MNPVRGMVLITGASSGIGRELARRFAHAGHSLVLTGRDLSALEGCAEELRQGHSVEVLAWFAELGTEEGTTQLLEKIAALNRFIEILVNNAGSGLHGEFVSQSAETDRAITTLHLLAPWRLTRALVPAMVQHGRGGILNVASVYSFVPAPWQAVYGAAKSGMRSMSLALREELRGTGVRVTALCPGSTASRFRSRIGLPEKPSRFTLSAAEVALAGYRGFTRNRATVVPGWYYQLYVVIGRLLPDSALGRYVSHTAYRLRGLPIPARLRSEGDTT